MKQLFFSFTITLSIAFTACTNSANNEHEGHDMNSMKADTVSHAATSNLDDIKTVAAAFSNVDAKAAASIKEIVDHYLLIKNALANDNADEAATGAKAMNNAISHLDKSLLSAEQKTAYDANETEMKEHAEHIAKNGDNIKHQRFHFIQLSEVIYLLVKDFGAGRPLYHDHCPMARDNQGAMWLSETKEISNPYFGAQMLNCGTVEEIIH
ncbi:MAG: DUF3347 domain-containing protein [Chitinophagaceae bacterium]|nr:DUF3347 domain-containing protein [Chitinophagaceae bacterium]